MALSVRLDRQAENDLRAIRDHLIENAGSDSAERVRRHLFTRIDRLRDAPIIGIVTTHPEIRLLPQHAIPTASITR